MLLLLLVKLCYHHGNAELVKVEVTEAVLSSIYRDGNASKCIDNVIATGKVTRRADSFKGNGIYLTVQPLIPPQPGMTKTAI